jgi:hypothetical protein
MEEKISHLIQAQAAYQSVTDQIPLLDEAIPTNPDVLSLATQLRNLGQEVNASVSAIQIGSVPIEAPKEPDGATTPRAGSAVPVVKLSTVPVHFVLTGNFPAMKLFLQNLLSMRRLVTLETIDIQPATDDIVRVGTPSASLRITLKATSFYTDK